MQNTHMLSVGNEHSMEWSVGVECWSGELEWSIGVESDLGVTNLRHSFAPRHNRTQQDS